MSTDAPAYGLWSLVIVNSIVFILFAYSFFKPRTGRDWRSFGAFSAFLVALFAEMYGFPLTIYFLSGWLQTRFPDVDWFSHDAGHLLEMMFGWKSNPHFGMFHVLSYGLIGGGFVLIATAWGVLRDSNSGVNGYEIGNERCMIIARIEIERAKINVGKHSCCAGACDRARRGKKTKRSCDHFVARPDA